MIWREILGSHTFFDKIVLIWAYLNLIASCTIYYSSEQNRDTE